MEENDIKNKIKKQTADCVRVLIIRSLMFGEPIDMNDIDSLIVAAYYLGRIDQRHNQERDGLYHEEQPVH